MEITASALQTVAANSNVIFTDTAIPGNCSIIHRSGSGLVKLRGLTTTQSRARFRISFGGNIAIPTGGAVDAISLAINIDGEPLQSATMIVTPAAVLNYFNVGADTFVDVPAGCCSTVTVTNTSGAEINVINSNLIIERVA